MFKSRKDIDSFAAFIIQRNMAHLSIICIANAKRRIKRLKNLYARYIIKINYKFITFLYSVRHAGMKFNDYFDKIPYLETERFVLRAFTRVDMEQYFNILRYENVQKYLGGGVPIFDEEPRISNWLSNINGRLLKSKKVFTWCVEEKNRAKLQGELI